MDVRETLAALIGAHVGREDVPLPGRGRTARRWSLFARIAAEELDVEWTRVQVQHADTSRGPQEGVTAGSLSLEHSGVGSEAGIRRAHAQTCARRDDLRVGSGQRQPAHLSR